MSKGPGVIEKRIADLFTATRDRALSVAEIADNAYQLAGRPATRAQRLSATRAAHRLIRRTKETQEKASLLFDEAARAVVAALGPAPRIGDYRRTDYEQQSKAYDEYRRKDDVIRKAHPAFKRAEKLDRWAEAIGVWMRWLPSERPDIVRAEYEFWRATETKDGRLWFHPPDAPVRVWAVSIEPAGLVWAEAEVRKITSRNVCVLYCGETGRLDREKLWDWWAFWRGVRFVSSRSGRAAQALDELWQEYYGRASGGVPPAMQMPLAEAIKLLGVSLNYTEADVKAAFRRLAKELHPDVGGDAEKFQQLVTARDRLLAALGVAAPKAPTFAPKGFRVAYRRVSVSSLQHLSSTKRLAR